MKRATVAAWPPALLLTLLATLARPAGDRLVPEPENHGSHYLDLVAGHIYGPGPLPEQATSTGRLSRLALKARFSGIIPMANNAGAEPNIPGEVFQAKLVDGKLADGTFINENIDVGYVALMNGQVRLLMAAVGGGPNSGGVRFYLDDDWNWTIHDDIGIDPGFALGVVHIDDFHWSTGPRLVFTSAQTLKGYAHGIDRAGDKHSGEYIPGRLGDDDGDGLLDGVFNAVGSFPLNAAFLPGAPFAQTRTFRSNVAVAPAEAAALTVANARSHLLLAAKGGQPVAELCRVAAERLTVAQRHLERARQQGSAAARIDEAEKELAQVASALAAPDAGQHAAELAERLRPWVVAFLGEEARS